MRPLHELEDILLDADAWGVRRLLERCLALSDEEFRRPMEIGPGSLHNTFSHLVRAAGFFAALLDGRPPVAPETGAPRSPAAMLEAYVAACTDLRGGVERSRGASAGDRIELPSRGAGEQRKSVSRAELIGQIGTHGAYHRAQVANMLRRLGVDPIPDTDLILWATERGDRRRSNAEEETT